jgi:hypothetical protein
LLLVNILWSLFRLTALVLLAGKVSQFVTVALPARAESNFVTLNIFLPYSPSHFFRSPARFSAILLSFSLHTSEKPSQMRLASGLLISSANRGSQNLQQTSLHCKIEAERSDNDNTHQGNNGNNESGVNNFTTLRKEYAHGTYN